MQIKEALRLGHEQLLLASGSARLDAEVLLAHILKKPATFLLMRDDKEIGLFALWRYKRMIAKRKVGVPVAYLTGHKEFFFLDFYVNRHVLTPRPDTETLVECVIEYIKQLSAGDIRECRLLDIGTGSACIPVSVLKNINGMEAIAADISKKALRVARRNIKKHGLAPRIKLIHSDLLRDVPRELLYGREIILTANLPYIPLNFQVNPELKYEPRISLYGGDDGLDVYKRLISQAKEIKPRAMFLELFQSQIAILKTGLPEYRLKYVKNMSGNARVMVLEYISN